MLAASPASNAVLEPSTSTQADAFLLEDERFERTYLRRKLRFLTLQQRKDVSRKRLFLLSDDRPWLAFLNGYSSRLQRRKLTFEHSRDFPTLHQASATGDRDQVRALLNAPGVCVLERDVCGRIALHHAVINEHLKVAKRFLRRRDAKLQIHVQDNSSRTALHYALEKMEVLALHRRDGVKRVPALVTAEMRMESKRYRRLWELADRMLEMVNRRVLDGECGIDGAGGENLKVLDMRCRGDMWDVCRSGDLERLEGIIKIYGCSKEDWELRELKRTLLHEACENQQLPVVYFLVSTICLPVGLQDVSGCTALHCAARRGYLDVCQVLLGKSPAECGDKSTQQNEAAEEVALIQDARRRTALHWCLLGSFDPRTRLQVATLLAQSCTPSLHVRDQDGVYPLHLAIWRGELELVQLFISLGASVCASSISTLQPKHDEDVHKAPWAPCGIVFQRRRLIKSQRVITPTVPIDEVSSSPTRSGKSTPDWENIQHPVEALWYWQLGSRHSESEEKMNESEKQLDKDGGVAITEEELGCRKYGGICARCKLTSATEAARASSPSPIGCTYQPLLSPLLLALRVCRLKRGDSMLNPRVAMVELLLMNGASPDGVCDTENASRESVQINVHFPPWLIEGLRTSLRYPQILPTLLQHGAERINTYAIIRWCLTVRSTHSSQVEALLNQLLDLGNIASSSEFLAMLFAQKYFHTLTDCVKQWSLKPTSPNSEENAGEGSESKQYCPRGASPWKRIYERLLAWDKERRKPRELKPIEIEHLDFLYGLSQPAREIAGGDVDLHGSDSWQLFEYCVDKYLLQKRNDYLGQKGESPTEKSEEILLSCICAVVKHWKRVEADNQLSKMTTWLQYTLPLGYLDCALVLLEALHRLGHRHLLLDTVFDLHASAIGDQHYFTGDQFRYHREFLIVCTENLLKVNLSATDQGQQGSNEVASFRSIVHMCANDFPLAFLKRCFDIVCPDGLTTISPGKSNAFGNMKTMRVRAKTMVQWIVMHARSDIMEWLLLNFPVGSERGLCWSKFVAAPRVLLSNDYSESNSTLPSFTDKIFLVYRENVHHHLSVSERKDLLISLMVNYAVPQDCVILMEQLINCWVFNNSRNDEMQAITVVLKEAHILHTIVRWNAIRVAEFSLSGQCSSEFNGVDWQQIFIEENQERHELDDCNSLELCRLLGHNHLYNVLSSKLLQVSFSGVEGDEKEEPGQQESVPSSETEGVSTTPWVFGLLRSVLNINDDLVAKSSEQEGIAENFKGYQRSVSTQDQWMSAVALDQVSQLRAMALTRDPYTNPDPSVCALVLTAIKSGSLNALKWIVNTSSPMSKYLAETESTECLYAAAKHSGGVYAEMTLLLLENQLSPGRLSGDGMGVPLLHRAACFTNTTLACRIMTKLLERSDCDVNALDAFGNTAVVYALAAGCLHNACFLIKHLKCRLEAEYEGQASFYYILHVVPSFASRAIVRELLLTKRDRAFLHCDAESKSCGCKGYERPRENEVSGTPRPCGFCGHESISHRIVPLPSWFRDQYDTYIAAGNSPRKRSHSSADDDSDTETSRHYPTEGEYDEDEEIVLENGRGRLDVRLLRRITELRYDGILHANGLSVAVVSENATASNDQVTQEILTARSDHPNSNNCGPTLQAPTKKGFVLAEEVDNVNEEVLPIVAIVDENLRASTEEGVGTSVELRNTKSGRKFADYPRWLQQELGMVHAPRCLCQTSAFVISRRQLAHVAVCRWLRRTAIVHLQQHHAAVNGLSCSPLVVTESTIIALASVQPAFEHWRGVVQLADQLPARAVPRPPTPLPRILSNVLFHWQHGKEFLAFQRWKNHRTSAEVTHHRLTTRLEHVAADMRRNRFMTLQLRQQQLQDSTRGLLP